MKARICVPIAELSLAAATEAIQSLPSTADIVEIRLDYIADLPVTDPTASIESLLNIANRSSILTFRPSEQGGAKELTQMERIAFWCRLRDLIKGRPQLLCDLEWDTSGHEELAWLPDEQRIVSYHNFTDTLEREQEILATLGAQPSRLIKLAVAGNSITDCLRIKAALHHAAKSDREMIAIVMDEPGLISRVLGPLWGSYLTFAARRKGSGSAAGQTTAEELTSLYRIREINEDTVITGLIGNPVGHSLSPAMHNAAFASQKINGVYLPLLVTDLDEFMTRFARGRKSELDWNLRGFSVTIPHKVNILPYLDDLSETAKLVGAVNTVMVEDGRLIGHNTDVYGALTPLKRVVQLERARVLIAGTGGAARAVAYGLVEEGSEVTICGRDSDKTTALAAEFGAKAATLPEVIGHEFDVLVNATSVGMSGSGEGAIEWDRLVPGCRVVYDLVYTPQKTELLKLAHDATCQTIGGLEMLIEQGAKQYSLWTGQDAPVEVMSAAALKRLAES